MTADAPLLLVEDNDDDVALARLVLAQAGVARPLVVARDGAEALALLLGGGDAGGAPPLRPALVLLDLNLPRRDGRDVLRALRADPRTRAQTVVMLTTSDDPADVDAFYALGANSYIRKPIDLSQLLAVLQRTGLSALAD